MKWEMKVSNVTTRLRKRTGPSTSYRITSYMSPGQTGIVVDSKTVGSSTWYKWEDGTWSSGHYLTKVKDLEPAVTPTPENPVKNEDPKDNDPGITLDFGNNNLNTSGLLGDSNNLGASVSNANWYQPSLLTFNVTKKGLITNGLNDKTTNDDISDNQILKELSRIKYNMDISYAYKSEAYYNTSSTYYSDLQTKLYNSFNRNKTPFADKELSKTFAYVFFTRPDLNILARSNGGALALTEQTGYDPKYKYLWANNNWCLKSLVTAGNSYHKFLVLLSNEAKSFEVNDTVLKTVEHGETYNGNKVIYGSSDQESNAAGEMSIRYVDTCNLDIFKLHVAWTDYINKVSRGIFEPKREYKLNRILDYASSCYYFLCGPDGSTILYWQKLTGVFPVNTGESTFSWDSGTLLAKPEINKKYMYSMRNTMDPYILQEFNSLTTANYNNLKVKMPYSNQNCQTGSTLTHSPYIAQSKVDGKQFYRLVWFDSK